jgi:hypothetical protein
MDFAMAGCAGADPGRYVDSASHERANSAADAYVYTNNRMETAFNHMSVQKGL